MHLLRLDSSARRGLSVSRAMTDHFVAAWKKANPASTVVERDLTTTPFNHVTDQWVQARDTDPAQHTQEHRQTLALSDELIGELKAADVIVLGSPMYNFGISASLKSWIDLIVRQGKTVDFKVRPPVGLLGGRKLVILTSTGGQYTAGSPTASFDFQEPYLRHIFGVIGLKDLTVIHADRQLYGLEVAALAQREAIQQIDKLILELRKEAL